MEFHTKFIAILILGKKKNLHDLLWQCPQSICQTISRELKRLKIVNLLGKN